MSDKKRLFSIPFLALLGLVVTSPFALAQTQPRPAEQDQVVKIKTDLIQLRAVVTDKKGTVIGGLKQEDFEVLESGKPQTLDFFSIERISVNPNEEPMAKASGRSEKAAPALPAMRLPGKPVRTIALFVDTANLSPISLLLSKQALHRFVDQQMTDQDLACVMPSAGSIGLLAQFTQDRQILHRAIDKLTTWQTERETVFTPYLASRVLASTATSAGRSQPSMAKDILDAASEAIRAEDGFPPNTIGEIVIKAQTVLIQGNYKRRVALATMKAIAERLAELPGQRLMILLSNGFTLMDTSGGQSTSEIQPIISQAARSGVVIYSLDAKGLNADMISAEFRGVPVTSSTSLLSFIQSGVREQEQGMTALAGDTGGEAFFGTNDLNGRLQRVLDNNRVYYVLAYYLPDEESPKKQRKITIHIKGHPDYIVRAQKGYSPADISREEKNNLALLPKQQLVKAMGSPLPVTTLGVSASADYFELEDDPSSVLLQVYIEGNSLEYKTEDQKHLFNLNVAAVVFDQSGKMVSGVSDDVKGALPPERLAVVKRNGLRSDRRLTLPPGLYQIRVGVLELGTERMGTASAWVEVPKIGQKKLAASDLLLTDQARIRAAAATQEPSDTSAVVSHIQQGIRYFQKSEILVYFLRVYPAQNTAKSEVELLMQSQIVKGEKSIYKSPLMPLAERMNTKDKKGIEISQELKLSSFSPGIYELRVMAKDPKSGQIAQRTILFGIEP
ncbi:MAG: VWA domain-containing protein [Acidobacteriota bacterium]